MKRLLHIEPEIAARHVDDWINSASELPDISEPLRAGATEGERIST